MTRTKGNPQNNKSSGNIKEGVNTENANDLYGT